MTQLSAVAADLGQREEALELGQRALAVVDDVDDPLEAARLFVWFGLSLAVIDAAVRLPAPKRRSPAAGPSGTAGRSRSPTLASAGARS